jgi:hypothetical protein
VVGRIDFSEGFDEINGVAFVAPEFRPDSMSIDCDPHWLKILATKRHKKHKSERVLLRFLCFFVAGVIS